MKCKSCGADLNSDVKFCISCGASQVASNQPKIINDKKHSTRNIKWIIAAVLVIAVLTSYMLKDGTVPPGGQTDSNISKTKNNQEQSSVIANIEEEQSTEYYEDFTKSISGNWDTSEYGTILLSDDNLGMSEDKTMKYGMGPKLPFNESAFPLGPHYTIESDIMLNGADKYNDKVGFTFAYRSIRGESNDGSIFLHPSDHKTFCIIADQSLEHMQTDVPYNVGEFAHLSVEVNGDSLLVYFNGQNVMESHSAHWDRIDQDEYFHPALKLSGSSYIKNIKIVRLD